MLPRTACIAVGLSLALFLSRASAQDKAPVKGEKTPPTVEQRLMMLEEQAAKMLAEIKAIRGQLKGAAADPSNIQIFRLRHVDSVQIAKLLSELLNINREKNTLRVVADPQTNSVLVAGKPDDQEMIQALLQRLDIEGADAAPPKKDKR